VADRETRLLQLAAALADGAPVDWDAAESTAASDSERRQIQRLRLVRKVTAATAVGSPGDDTRPHESLLHPVGGDDDADTTEAAPVVWGPLRVIEKIGRGRFGDVYRASDPRLDRDVALKLLKRRHADDEGAGSLAIEEGRLLAKVRHPNVVTVYGAERIENRVGLWMELVRGETLEDVVAGEPLTADEATAIGVAVCQALAAVHGAGLLHRDIKAQNVMRDDTGRVVLMDFGTGRELDVDAPAEFAGTPLYLAPEVLAGAPASRQSDLYSVGVLLYHLVTGAFPVTGRTLADIRAAHARVGQPGAVDQLDRLPEGLRAVIDRALSRDPGARFDSALDMAEALGRCRDASAASSSEFSSKVRRVDRRLIGAALLAGLVLLMFGARGSEIASWLGRQPPAIEPVLKRVWSGAGVDASGSPSPWGRYLTFTDWETGDLALRDFGAGTSRRLTNTGGFDTSGDYVEVSAISPDGRWVVYEWRVSAARKWELRVMPIDAHDDRSPRVVLRTELTDFVAPLGWTPDGSQVAVMRRTSNREELGLVTIADGAYRTITTLEGERLSRRGASLSPDGRYMAYEAPAAGHGSPRDILVVGIDGRSANVVVRGPHDDVSPFWTPDGSKILFLSDRTGARSLWMVPVTDGTATGPAVLLRADVGPITPLGFSRDGTFYYLLSGTTRRDVYVTELDELRASKPPARLTERFVNSNIGPTWSSDGEYLAFYSFRNAPTLVVRSTRTGDERDVALPAGVIAPFSSGPKWFSDNRSVLILRRDLPDSPPAFFRLWLDTARAELLHRADGGPTSYALSSDGRTIYYAVQQTNARKNSGRLMRYDIVGGRSTILKNNEWFIAVAISPDGHYLAYLKSLPRSKSGFSSAVEVRPSAGGEAREVFRDAPWVSGHRYNTLAWTPDGRALMFVRDDGRLWVVSANGGEPLDMGISMNARIKTPAIHPDGRRIAFGAVEADNNEVWVIENVLASAPVQQ
jgi:serine/threonine-protein kinase